MKNIYCNECDVYLGELAAGSKTRKDIVYLCDGCMATLTINKYKSGSKSSYEDIFNSDLFKQMFGGGSK
jgi:hypothetical protein